MVRKSGALSSPCGYPLLIAVITAVANWMIAITKGSHFLFPSFSRVSPSYTLYTLYCVQKTTVYFDFYKQKNHRIIYSGLL